MPAPKYPELRGMVVVNEGPGASAQTVLAGLQNGAVFMLNFATRTWEAFPPVPTTETELKQPTP